MGGKVAKHTRGELQQMQSLPLDAKITLTKERIKAWYEGWTRVEIVNGKTGNRRAVCFDCRDPLAEPPLKEHEYIDSWTQGAVYVSFSGGKDSTVLKHIVDSMYNDVPAVFFNTGLEYPEIQRFVKDIKAGRWECFNPDVEIIRPSMRFDEVIKKYGYPVVSKEVSKRVFDVRRKTEKNGMPIKDEPLYKAYFTKESKPSWYKTENWSWLFETDFGISHNCCDVMKKRPAHKFLKKTSRMPIIAMQAGESSRRRSKWLAEGCNAFDNKQPTSNPLSFWTEQDILQYIKRFNVPYCSDIYGDIVADGELDGQTCLFDEDCGKLKLTGVNRTGCMFCMYGVHLEKEPNRFQRMKVTHPKQYAYCMKPVEEGGLGLAHVLDVLCVKY